MYFTLDTSKTNKLYESLLGFILTWTWFPIGITVLIIASWPLVAPMFSSNTRVNGNLYEQFGNNDMMLSRSSLQNEKLSRSSFLYRVLIVVLFVCILIPGLWVSTTLLVGDWHQATTSNIKSFAQQSKPRSHWTTNIVIGNSNSSNDNNGGNYVMHVYFDVLIYYAGLLTTFVIGFMVKHFGSVSKRLRKEIVLIPYYFFDFENCSPKFSYFGLTLLQTMVGLLWTGIFVLIFVMFYWYHNFTGMQEGMPESTEKLARTMGILATAFLGLSMFPVSRGNFINRYCLGLSFEACVKYHKILGSLMSLCAILHGILWVYNFVQADLWSLCHPFSSVPWFNGDTKPPTQYHADNFSLPLMWVFMIICFIPFLYIGSVISWFRRKFFEVWYSIHIYCALVTVVAVLFHATSGWYFIVPGLAIQFYERLYRLFVTCTDESFIIDIKTNGDSALSGATHLVVSRSNKYPETPLGAYYFINIPNINPFEWHPFSVSNTLNNEQTEFDIRCNKGYIGWSSKLYDMAQKFGENMHESTYTQALSRLTINLEGPYGSDLNYNNYDAIILIAGGIGITPFHNIFFSLYNEVQSGFKNQIPFVQLVWVVRYADMFEMYYDSFSQFAQYPASNMKIELFATRGAPTTRKNSNGTDATSVQSIQQQIQVDCPLDWQPGRPDLKRELKFLKAKGRTALVCFNYSTVFFIFKRNVVLILLLLIV